MRLRIILCILIFALSACATAELKPYQVQVAGKTKTYVIGKIPIGVLGDETVINDRYDENGVLQHPADVSTTGTVHDALKAAAGSTGTAALVTPIITPIVNDVQGK
jgi:hypothetical protein